MDKNEITSLNFAELDVEELEHRLEMASAQAQPMAWVCGADCPKLSCVGHIQPAR